MSDAKVRSEVFDKVDVFHGHGAVDLPVPQGIAARWNWLKAQVGNTHPGACNPLGMVSAGAYSGAYPTGYGLYATSCSGTTPKYFQQKTATGFTHFHQSGVGAVGHYYNYLRVMPWLGTIPIGEERWNLQHETGQPGYYRCELQDTPIQAELTVSPKVAVHRYTYRDDKVQPRLAIDIATGGLRESCYHGLKPSKVALTLIDPRSVQGHIVMDGLAIYFYLEIQGTIESTDCWIDGQPIPSRQSLHFSIEDTQDIPRALGILFTIPKCNSPHPIELRIGFSLCNEQQAWDNLLAVRHQTFDQIRLAARDTWSSCLERIQVTGGTDSQRRIFYSCLYHSLIKPINCTGENPFGNSNGPCFLDFSTLWDMYKTQLPLVLTLLSESARDIVNSMLGVMERTGYFPNALLLRKHRKDQLESQAKHLSHLTLVDAYYRQVNGIDWVKAKNLMAASLRTLRDAPSTQAQGLNLNTHTLDIAQACFATATIARGVGDHSLAASMTEQSQCWRNAFDSRTGLLDESSQYYEGTAWNYSFRLLPDMASRIAMCGGDAAFVHKLDTFFGYMDTEPEFDSDSFSRLPHDDRFEGLNNEPDMESPYAYIYVGRHDRTAEVVRAVMQYQFAARHGGLPGNDDSGALSSWYVWNAIGLFPVTGQPYMLIGSPSFESVRLSLPQSELSIVAQGTSAKNMYVHNAMFNGKPLDRAYLTMKEFLRGGELVLSMCSRPSGWAGDQRPPSYSDVEQLSRGDF